MNQYQKQAIEILDSIHMHNLRQYLKVIADKKPSTIIYAHKYLSIRDHNEENFDDDLISLIKQGKKISAIKLYRQRTSCRLLIAKNYIDNLAEKV